MALLERVNSMKQQGFSETDIANALKEEGNTPTEIEEVMSQSKIKAAVAENFTPSGYETSNVPGMQASIMDGSEQPAPVMAEEPQVQAPMPAMPMQTPMQSISQQSAAAPAPAYDQYQYPAESAYPAEAQYAQGYAPQYGYAPETTTGYYQQVLDIETVRDISKQQVEEALRKMREDLLNFSKMKSELKFEMQDIDNRLLKVESQMAEIQASIIRKIGEYGDSISSISKEIRATQQSFSKMVNPMLDKSRGASKAPSKEAREEAEEEPEREEQIAPKKQPAKKFEKKSPRPVSGESSSPSFEDYFR
jgi:hypothetical protein